MQTREITKLPRTHIFFKTIKEWEKTIFGPLFICYFYATFYTPESFQRLSEHTNFFSGILSLPSEDAVREVCSTLGNYRTAVWEKDNPKQAKFHTKIEPILDPGLSLIALKWSVA